MTAHTQARRELAALVERTWGGDAVRALADAERAYGEARVARVDDVVFWLEAVSVAIPRSVVTPLAFEDGAWRVCRGIDGWRAAITACHVDAATAAGRQSALAAFARLAGPVVATQAEARALVAPPTREERGWVEPPVAAPDDVLLAFEPPHCEGRAFVFCANLSAGTMTDGAGPAFVRVALDLETTAVDVTRICDGRDGGVRFYLKGRAYASRVRRG